LHPDRWDIYKDSRYFQNLFIEPISHSTATNFATRTSLDRYQGGRAGDGKPVLCVAKSALRDASAQISSPGGGT
jgi:hypothetical protein